MTQRYISPETLSLAANLSAERIFEIIGSYDLADATLQQLRQIEDEALRGGRFALKLVEPIEAINISDTGEALVGMVDFRTGEDIVIEQQADAGTGGIYGWEGKTIAYYRSRGWNADTETVFRANDHRYVTFNLPRTEAW